MTKVEIMPDDNEIMVFFDNWLCTIEVDVYETYGNNTRNNTIITMPSEDYRYLGMGEINKLIEKTIQNPLLMKELQRLSQQVKKGTKIPCHENSVEKLVDSCISLIREYIEELEKELKDILKKAKKTEDIGRKSKEIRDATILYEKIRVGKKALKPTAKLYIQSCGD